MSENLLIIFGTSSSLPVPCHLSLSGIQTHSVTHSNTARLDFKKPDLGVFFLQKRTTKAIWKAMLIVILHNVWSEAWGLFRAVSHCGLLSPSPLQIFNLVVVFSWFPSLCCAESEDSIDEEFSSMNSLQQSLYYLLFAFRVIFSSGPDVLHTVILTVCKYKPCQQRKPHQF